MNKVYKVIYSKAKACYVVASEFAKRDGKCSTDKRQSSRQTMKLAAALVAFLVSIGGGGQSILSKQQMHL